MEAICKNCDHWETNTPVVQEKNDYGECNVLSPDNNASGMRYVLPVLDSGTIKKAEVITAATFGCNQFEA